MTEFHEFRRIKSTRKDHRCESCPRPIPKGSRATYISGKSEGELYSFHQHEDCHAAAAAYANLHGLYGEEWPWFAEDPDLLKEATPFLIDEFPEVAERLGIEIPERTEEQKQRARNRWALMRAETSRANAARRESQASIRLVKAKDAHDEAYAELTRANAALREAENAVNAQVAGDEIQK